MMAFPAVPTIAAPAVAVMRPLTSASALNAHSAVRPVKPDHGSSDHAATGDAGDSDAQAPASPRDQILPTPEGFVISRKTASREPEAYGTVRIGSTVRIDTAVLGSNRHGVR